MSNIPNNYNMVSGNKDNKDNKDNNPHSQNVHLKEINNLAQTSISLQKSTQSAIKEYVNEKNIAKQNMADKLSKQDMVNIIFKQNDMISQQSSQMLEIVEMANTIEKNARINEASKCSNIIRVTDVCTRNINDMCKKGIIDQHQQINFYENSIKIQIVLFILLLIVLIWLLCHYYGSNGSC